MADGIEELRTRVVALIDEFERANHNRAYEEDPNRPLRDFTAPRADEIQLGYITLNILAEEYQRSLFRGMDQCGAEKSVPWDDA
jgi:hypothetical protein